MNPPIAIECAKTVRVTHINLWRKCCVGVRVHRTACKHVLRMSNTVMWHVAHGIRIVDMPCVRVY